MIMIGGHSGRQKSGPTYHGDVWQFDFRQRVWHPLLGAPVALLKRSWHNAVALDPFRILVALGYQYVGHERYYDDFFCLEVGEQSVSCTVLSKNDKRGVLTPRNRASMVKLCNLPTNTKTNADTFRLFVFGGNSFDGNRDTFYNDAAFVDVDTHKATVTVQRVGTDTKTTTTDQQPNRVPHALGHASSVSLSESDFLLIGGEKSRKRLKSVFRCRVENNKPV